MKKTEIKYYCDFCHKECTHEHYNMRLPYLQKRQYQTRGEQSRFLVDPTSCILKNKYNLCKKCAITVSQVCEFLPKFCINDGTLAQTMDSPNKVDDPWNHPDNPEVWKNKHKMILEYEE